MINRLESLSTQALTEKWFRLDKKYPTEYRAIITLTSFLPINASPLQRCYHIVYHLTSIPTCQFCDNPVKWEQTKKQYAKTCGRKCQYKLNHSPQPASVSQKEKRKQTIIDKYGSIDEYYKHIHDKRVVTMKDRYGVEYSGQSSEITDRRKRTCLEKYGVNNPLVLHEIRQKGKQTTLERYNVEYHQQSEEGKRQRQQTIMDRYNTLTPLESPIIRAKIKQTLLERYGVDNPRKSKIIKEKIKQIWLDKHGVDNPHKSETIREQSKRTCLAKYDVEYYNQHHMSDIVPLLNDYDWLVEQYITQNKTAIQLASELNISNTTIGRHLRKHEIEIKQTYKQSYKAIQWLESIIAQEEIVIQYALNGGEYQIPNTRYKADGYCKETNTIYEFHGDYWHGNPDVYNSELINESTNCTMGELYQKTIEREQLIRDLGYDMIVQWENDFKILSS